ncbi:chemotaxis protein CheY [Porphyromonas crevioricanis]|uniref:T9SS response regulator signal transducer PorX n=1 Tax=Porphyromonas crevioricanis TaxID=393921 RepID=UPI00052B8702|nr:bifunctional response regulator/alkaline phosphatase family protein [Porphyromonas crevioricanis]KGN90270.1 chemotaxis protein CheY [Porphyromonas crevioricanis]
MRRYSILWADDEIDLLRPHILFLEAKGYDVTAVNSGLDALEALREQDYDIIFLDEMMPGLTGLETLLRIKALKAHIPVVMVTKSEEEQLMNEAIGRSISDYLIKPINPNQLLLSLKKHVHEHTLKNESAIQSYRQDFSDLSVQISDCNSMEQWKELYRKLVYWDLELEQSAPDMAEMLEMQKREANLQFVKFVKEYYADWMAGQGRPLMSSELIKTKVLPPLDAGEKVFFILIDNFRLDQWEAVKTLLTPYYSFDEDLYCSILPSVTHYARNAIFAGLMPADIARMYPDMWIDEESEEGKNQYEEQLLSALLQRYRKNYSFSYHKVYDTAFGEKLLGRINSLKQYDLNVIVLNFVDMMSHARTESKMMRELAGSEAAYRSITKSWFEHSTAMEMFKRIAQQGARVILTTDHGTIRVHEALKVIGDRSLNTNLRYKAAKNLTYKEKEVYEILKPEQYGLPRPGLSGKYIFATGSDFFAYPNNFNHYVQYYQGTFQHGGISLEELLIPVVDMQAK